MRNMPNEPEKCYRTEAGKAESVRKETLTLLESEKSQECYNFEEN